MDVLLGVSRAIDRMNIFLGKVVGYFILASILISAINAMIRKTFSISSNWALELQWHLFGAAILIGAAWTLLRNEHVRIDIFINQMPPRWRNIVDLVGHFIVLIPFSLLGAYEAWPWVKTSFDQQETSSNFGGLIIWPVKSSIMIGFILLFIQAISEIIKRIATLQGRIPDPHAIRTEPHAGDATSEGAI
jgi:TRAP-type mannitol/chloroaromatic compound transport system permease small subunit